MKCADCPLCVSDYSEYFSDGDCYCLLTQQYADVEEGSCRRTDKFINSQNVAELKRRWMQSEANMWSDYLTWMEEQQNILTK